MDLFLFAAVAFTGLIVLGMYDSKKKSQVRLEEIKLEREKVALEKGITKKDH